RTVFPAAGANENAPALTATIANRYRISAVASLASPSPSRMTRIRFGSRSLRAIESGATASGGETIAPRANPTGHENPRSQCAAAAAVTVVNTTQPMASNEIGRKLKRNSRQLIATADE